MSNKTLRILTATSLVAALMIAATPASAHFERHERHYGYGERYEQSYRPVIVQPRYGYAPPSYGYAQPPMYYASPRAYIPEPDYYRPPIRMHQYRTGRR